jgi:flagellar biosynthesis protein FliP
MDLFRNLGRSRLSGSSLEEDASSSGLSLVTDDTLSSSVMGTTMKKPGLATSYAQHKLARDAALESAHEKCRALLTKDAIDNAIALTVYAVEKSGMVPMAEERCQAIVNAFVFSTMERMRNW